MMSLCGKSTIKHNLFYIWTILIISRDVVITALRGTQEVAVHPAAPNWCLSILLIVPGSNWESRLSNYISNIMRLIWLFYVVCWINYPYVVLQIVFTAITTVYWKPANNFTLSCQNMYNAKTFAIPQYMINRFLYCAYNMHMKMYRK